MSIIQGTSFCRAVPTLISRFDSFSSPYACPCARVPSGLASEASVSVCVCADSRRPTTQAWAASGECKHNPLYMLGDPGQKNGQCMWACKVRAAPQLSRLSILRSVTSKVTRCRASKPHRAASGWARPPCRQLKTRPCCRLGSAFEWRLSKPFPRCLRERTVDHGIRVGCLAQSCKGHAG